MNFSSFIVSLSTLLIFCKKSFESEIEYNDFYHSAYIEYKTWCKEYHEIDVKEWAFIFYQELHIEEHGLMLKCKHLEWIKPLKDIANKSGLK